MSVPIYPPFMVWNWVSLGLGTWSLLPSARRKKPLMQIRKGRKQQLLIWLFCDQNPLKWTLIQWVFWRNIANKYTNTTGGKKKKKVENQPKAFIPSSVSFGVLSSATARFGKNFPRLGTRPLRCTLLAGGTDFLCAWLVEHRAPGA